MKKYELTNETKVVNGITLHRIVALRDFADVKAGDLGGFVQSEHNLCHRGKSWIYDEACVFERGFVFSNAKVCDQAQVYTKGWVYGNAKVSDSAKVSGDAHVCGDVQISDNLEISGDEVWGFID